MAGLSKLSKQLIIAGGVLTGLGLSAPVGIPLLIAGLINYFMIDQGQPSEPSNVSTSSYDMDCDYADSSCADSEVI